MTIKIKYINWVLVALGVVFIDSMIFASDGFKLSQLPKGKSVTLPTLTSTLVSKIKTVRITSTDLSQVLKITISRKNPKNRIKIAIYDNHLDRVKYVNIYKNKPVLYSFKDISSIQIISDLTNNKRKLAKNSVLILESNRPVSISH